MNFTNKSAGDFNTVTWGMEHERWFLVKGRYTGDFGGVYLHGGLSLMECLTPWLVMRHKNT